MFALKFRPDHRVTQGVLAGFVRRFDSRQGVSIEVLADVGQQSCCRKAGRFDRVKMLLLAILTIAAKKDFHWRSGGK
jgi:hypothetical protein